MRRLLLTLAALALLAALPGPAHAKSRPIVGVADQGTSVFAHPLYGKLRVGRISRLVVSYDAVLRRTDEMQRRCVARRGRRGRRPAADLVQRLARLLHLQGPYSSGGSAGCRRCALYRKAFRAFRKRYPQVRVYSPWNEINHHSQPTARNPKRAAQFTTSSGAAAGAARSSPATCSTSPASGATCAA